MTKKRCIRCEQAKDKSDFQHGHYPEFCGNCHQNYRNNESRRFRYTFLAYGKELFCLKYDNDEATARSLVVSIPSDNEGKKKLVKDIKKKVDEGLNFYVKEEEIEKNSERHAEVLANIGQLESYYYQVRDFEKKYS